MSQPDNQAELFVEWLLDREAAGGIAPGLVEEIAGRAAGLGEATAVIDRLTAQAERWNALFNEVLRLAERYRKRLGWADAKAEEGDRRLAELGKLRESVVHPVAAAKALDQAN